MAYRNDHGAALARFDAELETGVMRARLAALALIGIALPSHAAADPDLAPLPAIEINVIALGALGSVTNLYPPHSTALVEGNMWGPVLAGELGYRFSQRFSTGFTVRAGRFTGSYRQRLTGEISYSIIALDIAGYVHARPADRVWGGFFAGPHLDGTRFDANIDWTTALGLGFEVGGDLFTSDGHWVSLVGAVTASRLTDMYFGSVGIGLAYRR